MKQQRPLTIEGGRLVTPAGVQGGALRLVDGCIDGVGTAAQNGDEVIDAGGALVAPGLVDLGVFAIDKPAFHFGGITRAALMPDQSPRLDLPSRVSYIAKSGKPDFWVHPLAAATRDLAGAEIAELGLMREAGARGVARLYGYLLALCSGPGPDGGVPRRFPQPRQRPVPRRSDP